MGIATLKWLFLSPYLDTSHPNCPMKRNHSDPPQHLKVPTHIRKLRLTLYGKNLPSLSQFFLYSVLNIKLVWFSFSLVSWIFCTSFVCTRDSFFRLSIPWHRKLFFKFWTFIFSKVTILHLTTCGWGLLPMRQQTVHIAAFTPITLNSGVSSGMNLGGCSQIIIQGIALVNHALYWPHSNQCRRWEFVF